MSEHASEQKIGDWATLSPPGTLPVLDNIFQVSDKFLGQLKLYLEQHPPSVPITSILGFQQFTAQLASEVVTNETTGSLTYVDLTTVGPSLSTLPDGKYLILLSCQAKNPTANDGAVMSVSINGAAATDANCALTFNANYTSIVAFAAATLSAGSSNTIVSKYRADVGGTANFQRRKLVALRYANP